MTLEEKVNLLMKHIEVLQEDLSCLQLQIDLIANKMYDDTNEYDVEL